MLREQAAAFLEHAPGARASEHPEHVHQMRVATRRMRAALRVFADVLPTQAGSLNDELKWIAGELGAVRDLDVQIRRSRDTAVELCLAAALVPYADWLERQRERAHVQLVASLESRRYRQLTDRLLDADALVIDGAADHPLLEDASRRLKRALRRLRKAADPLDETSPSPALHAVRIRAKRLRYTLEFYAPTYGDLALSLIRSVTALQDLLGSLQDGVVSDQHIQSAVQTEAGDWPLQTTLALGQTLQYEAQRSQKMRRAFPAAYRAVRGKAWKRLRGALRQASTPSPA